MIGFLPAAAGFAAMLAMMLIGIPVAVTLFLTALLGTLAYLGIPTLMMFGTQTWSVLNDFILTAIPLFIFLGELLVRSGVADGMYRSLTDWLRRLPGGLLHTNIASSSLFAAVSGSSVATAATIGTVAIPTMEKYGYEDRITLGSIAAGATLGILIPPSINMIIYGSMSNTSIGQLFAAGIVPGIVLALLFMAYIAVASLLKPSIAGRTPPSVPLAQKLRNLLDILPPLMIFALVMGSIYLGWATPSESAALGVIGALVVTIAKRRFSFAMLHEAMLSTVKISAMILLIVVAAQFLNFVIGILGVPQMLTAVVGSIASSPLEVLLLLVVFYFVLGCFLETLSMMIATIPIVMPIVIHFGIDPVWFGIFLVIMMEVALITPPLGMNLFIVQGVRGRGSVADVMWGSMPFVAIMLAMIVLLIAFPGIALWLPGQMFP
ncbi:TRAP transporter large permease [Aurantimonas endophytica]|uniref:TRAP transporter large permease protein n=1 Tax=Aurantimonas endophytica TaxID=1522175 RepID=A0A7W6HBH0_9HYPH|nr:TRAP transporter large permease [Aurantimonas endophytica]MBB4002052.1 tripartite ATP-independent transporter DctM subunit [Aurantimonas endophytica]MCO6402316.1 TRAP transporter large permease subunit [Aurantimonas endophytica]